MKALETNVPSGRSVIVWNTGRHYSPNGQLLIACKSEIGGVLFFDAVRMIEGYLPQCVLDPVMITQAYDANQYEPADEQDWDALKEIKPIDGRRICYNVDDLLAGKFTVEVDVSHEMKVLDDYEKSKTENPSESEKRGSIWSDQEAPNIVTPEEQERVLEDQLYCENKELLQNPKPYRTMSIAAYSECSWEACLEIMDCILSLIKGEAMSVDDILKAFDLGQTQPLSEQYTPEEIKAALGILIVDGYLNRDFYGVYIGDAYIK